MLQALWDFLIDATDEDYPIGIHIPHNFISLARYREWREEEGQPMQWLYDIVMSFFSHSQGSGAFCLSLLQSKSMLSYCTPRDYSHYHLLVYLATYWSPRDIVYRVMKTPRHPLRLFCVAADALDGMTTCAQVVDQSISSEPSNKLLPIISCIVCYSSGQIFQHLDALSRGDVSSKSWLARPSSDATRGTFLGCVYWFFAHMYQKGRHRNRALVIMCILECLLEVLEEAFDFDAYEKLHVPGLALLRGLRKHLALGPPCKHLEDDCGAKEHTE